MIISIRKKQKVAAFKRQHYFVYSKEESLASGGKLKERSSVALETSGSVTISPVAVY